MVEVLPKCGRTVALQSGSTSPAYIDGELCRSSERRHIADDNYLIRSFDCSCHFMWRSRIYAWKRYWQSKKVIVPSQEIDYFLLFVKTI